MGKVPSEHSERVDCPFFLCRRELFNRNITFFLFSLFPLCHPELVSGSMRQGDTLHIVLRYNMLQINYRHENPGDGSFDPR